MDEDGKTWKWAIEPNPYDADCDVLVTDSDDEARIAILYAAEMVLYDANEGGETRVLKVTHILDAKKGGAG
jgi:hypothetical protein